MLERAAERVGRAAKGRVKTVEGDFRDVPLPAGAFQAAVACAVLHHLRDAGDWERAFAKIHSLLAPGGVMLVYDLVRHDNPAVEALFRARHERFLRDALGDEEAARNLRSIAESDTPSSLEFQFGLLRKTGFREVGLLHKTVVFGAYYALK